MRSECWDSFMNLLETLERSFPFKLFWVLRPMGESLPETPIELFLTSTSAAEFCFLGSTFLLDFGPPCSELDSSIEEANPESLV